jgi:hypothetical protein
MKSPQRIGPQGKFTADRACHTILDPESSGRWFMCSAPKRLERTRHERASLLSNVGEPLKRSVGLFTWCYGKTALHSHTIS